MMEFPIIQIDLIEWNLELITELLMFDGYYHSSDDDFFDKYILSKRFVSSDGTIYIATHKTRSTDFLSRTGLRSKYKIHFKDAGVRWTFSQTKEFFYNRIFTMKEEFAKENWLKIIDRSNSIRDLIESQDD
ncbi:MAG: hypothetical protein LBF27_10290 [Sphingobacterium sp.]|nr:hypothetical protein [Sphingobacterium sp.]